MFILFHCFV
jgi:calcium-dependent protein kinase